MGTQVPPALMQDDEALLDAIVESIEEMDDRLDRLEALGRPEAVMLHVTREEAEAVRDILARVSGNGPKAKAVRQVFETLESVLGYDVMIEDGLEGEIECA